MEQQKEFTVSEQSQSQEDNNKSTSIKYEAVKNTPFTLIRKDDEVMITIGNQICSPIVFKSEKEARKHINQKKWLLIATTAMILAEKNCRTKTKQRVKLWQLKETLAETV